MQAPSVMYGLQVDMYSHHFTVSKFNARGKEVALAFCRHLAQYGLVRISRTQFERKPVKIYAAATADRGEFRFHINELETFKRLLEQYGIVPSSVNWVEHELYVPQTVDFSLKDTRAPRDKQVPIIEYLSGPCMPGFAPSKAVTLQTGGGKAQPLDVKIRVPGGWKTMGEMQIGQEVISPDGSVTQVTGVFPQGEKEIYRVVFGDGRSTECCAEHLWKVFYINTSASQRWRVVNTVEMLRLISMPNPRVYVQLIEPEEGIDAELPIDPYLVGLLLGDGCMRHDIVAFSSADAELVESVRRLLPATLTLAPSKSRPYDYIVRGGIHLREQLKEIGVYGRLSYQKAIPALYGNASRQQRLALLQGLMDSDGTVGSHGSAQFSSCSLELAMGVQEIVRSLGGIGSISLRNPTYTYQGVQKKGRVAYVVNIRIKQPSQLFRLVRKKEKVNDQNQYADGLKLRVKSIDLVSRKEAQCISVAAEDRLYVTDDYIVTHNTFSALKAVNTLSVRTMLVVQGKFVKKWIGDVEDFFNLKKGDLMVVRGSDHLQTLIQLAKEGKLEAKFLIATSKTMYNYMKAYEQNPEDEAAYGVHPEKFYETLGVGLRIIDEVHIDFHNNFRQDLYSHLPMAINLSATLEPDDPFIEQRYLTAFPKVTRAPEVEYHKYIAAKTLWYAFNRPEYVRCTNFFKQYNHTTLENWIMKDKQRLSDYVEMICDLTRDIFIDIRVPGQKMFLFCATVDMCNVLHRELVTRHGDLVINRYVSEDEYEKLLDADLAVTTLLSAGTAVDVPNLRVCLMTTMLSSKQGNIQALGRLRPLKDWPDVTPEFYFLAARNLDKHVGYIRDKKHKLEGKIVGFTEIQTAYHI